MQNAFANGAGNTLTYRELKEQLAALDRQAEAARAAEIQSVVETIRAQIAEYGITERDLFDTVRGSSAKHVKQTLPPKYRDPETGATWAGRGRTPAWLTDETNRDRFLIKT